MAFVLLIEVEATINVLFSCHFYTFTVFLRVIKGIQYHQIIITLYSPNSMTFPFLPFVKLNVFGHTGTLLHRTDKTTMQSQNFAIVLNRHIY